MNEHPYKVDWYHCSHIERNYAWVMLCDAHATVFHVRPDGVKVGYCHEHRDDLPVEERRDALRVVA